MALLSIETSLDSLQVHGDYRFRHGQYVLAIGNPAFGQDILINAVTDGVMSSHATLDNATYFQVTMSVNPGNSGGPVLDADARVIGVVAAKATKQERMAFVIPASDLEGAIQSARRQSSEELEKKASYHQSYVAFTWLNRATKLYSKGCCFIPR